MICRSLYRRGITLHREIGGARACLESIAIQIFLYANDIVLISNSSDQFVVHVGPGLMDHDLTTLVIDR